MPIHKQPQPSLTALPKNKVLSQAYWFVLGRESLIAAAELHAVLNFKAGAYEFAPPILKAGLNQFDARDLMKKLGGTIKIAQEIGHGLSEEKMAEIISEELKLVEGKINFGLSFYAPGEKFQQLFWLKKTGLNIKKNLKAGGLSIRYVENREPVLSSVTVDKNGLTERGREFLITLNTGKYSIAKTLAVQPFEEFGERDFGRPGRDDLSGMLPPKLAMMMINLSKCPKDGVLLDPSCGSGTIITEAMFLGYKNLIGTDISAKAISDTEKNIEWLKTLKVYHEAGIEPKILELDVKKLSSVIGKNSTDAIVTEPYLGKPLKGNETEEELVRQVNELKQLYLKSFQEFYKILKPGGTVVFIIPCFKYRNEWLRIECENEIKKISAGSASGGGFATEKLFENHTSLLYARPDQKVGREIWKFKKI